ncbi:MAG: anaerobic ribonucleoside-triphosphate reductase [Thermodesulfobacteriaceae bacterium]|nr:anaerobic ribonucleoside-triphosphate reductase [Caldimicrobium sp.]MCX8041214.1 anaerobic ribonucleoside-triphosphate reductase [Thermodesulfobacteriaceae bacterium]MDW8136644.1 anaerobic ribonucleoside-triphosphate reductase [Thermodesulfobacterium sp.]
MEKNTMETQVETKKVEVIPCEVYSRVVGYFRPVQNWNPGKQQEFAERKTIKINSYLKLLKLREIHS